MKSTYSAIAMVLLLASCGKKYTETTPEIRDVTETVFASGILVPENEYNLTAQSDGYLVELNFEEGDVVQKNDLLAVIDNKTSEANQEGAQRLLTIAQSNLSPNAPALKQSEISLNNAKLKLQQDSLQAERYKKLYASNSVSKLEYENMLLAYQSSLANYKSAEENYRLQKQLAEQQFINQKTQSEINNVLTDNNELRAVLGGKIYKKLKELGDFVRRGEIIAVIGHPSSLYAELSIDEASISKIKEKQEAFIQLNIDKEKMYNGYVAEIFPSFDSQSQSFRCKVNFKDSLQFPFSGTQLQANITTEQKNDVLVIPRNYLNYGNTVMLDNGEFVKVKTGFVSTEWVEILEGIDIETVIRTEK